MGDNNNPVRLPHKGVLLSALCILLLSVALALAMNQLRSRPVVLFEPLPQLQLGDLGLDAGAELLENEEVLFVDARSTLSFRKSHITDSVNLSLTRFSQDYEKLATRLEGKMLVVYCSNRRCPKADKLRSQLESRGHRNIRVLRPGFQEWVKAGMPVDRPGNDGQRSTVRR